MNIKDRRHWPGILGVHVKYRRGGTNTQGGFKIHPAMPCHPWNTILGRLCWWTLSLRLSYYYSFRAVLGLQQNLWQRGTRISCIPPAFTNACMHAKSLQSCPTLLHKSRLFFISHFSVKFDKVDVFLSLVPRKTAKWIVKKYHFLFVLQRSFLALREKLNLTELIRQGRFCSRLSQKEREIEHTLLK